MLEYTFDRLVDVSVVMTLCAVLICLSASVVILDKFQQRTSEKDHGTCAILLAHAFYLLAAVGLELGRTASFSVSASLVVFGTHCGLVAGYIGTLSAIEERPPRWRWLQIAIAIALFQAATSVITQSLTLVFLVTSLINGTLAIWFSVDVFRRTRGEQGAPTWLLIVPFCGIAIGYYLRLALVLFGASSEVVVIASIGIGLVFPMATLFWVFGAMSLRNLHLNYRLDSSAKRDALTGLENRVALERFKAQLPHSERRSAGRYAACICIDLDHFKEINDTYGHAGGDAVLSEVAQRLMRLAHPLDKIFRIGGDEFVFWKECDREADLDAFLEILLRTLCEPVRYGTNNLAVGASIGLDTSNDHISPWDLIRRADIALYCSKETGRQKITRYSDQLGSVYDGRLRALEEFRTAIEKDQLAAYFQPQIDAHTGALTGCEALARWKHPNGTVLGPDAFIPLAEELGLMPQVDRRVLQLAVEAAHVWQQASTPVPRISVNVSAARLMEPGLFCELEQYTHSCPSKISIEILETVFVDNDNELGWQADKLRDLGVDIEVDDFGTGHASISAVLSLRPTRIKIARIFVSDAAQDPQQLDVLRSLVDLSKRMGSEVIIEGVETAEQLAAVQSLGPIEIQGYLIAKPMDVTSMSDWLTENYPKQNPHQSKTVTA
jgi:diguanylate cyclase (GGDEF)-like protein